MMNDVRFQIWTEKQRKTKIYKTDRHLWSSLQSNIASRVVNFVDPYLLPDSSLSPPPHHPTTRQPWIPLTNPNRLDFLLSIL